MGTGTGELSWQREECLDGKEWGAPKREMVLKIIKINKLLWSFNKFSHLIR